MRNIPLYALLFLAISPAYALDFSFEKNHCATGEYRPKEPKSGGTSGVLDSTAWAETGLCVKIPIAKLQAAAADLGVIHARVCSPSSLLLSRRHAAVYDEAVQAFRERWNAVEPEGSD